MKKDVMLVIGAGQIGMAIARRVGFGKKIILGDKNIDNARTVALKHRNMGRSGIWSMLRAYLLLRHPSRQSSGSISTVRLCC